MTRPELPKRLSAYPSGVSLDTEAPAGTYEVDRCLEYFDEEHWARYAGDHRSMAADIRHTVALAASAAIHSARAQIEARNTFEAAQDLFDRIERLSNDLAQAAERGMSLLAVEASKRRIESRDALLQYGSESRDLARLVRAFDRAREDMADFALGYEPRAPSKAPPNLDPIGRDFVTDVFLLWRRLTPARVTCSPRAPFVVFLTAAWRDVGFPPAPAGDGTKPLEDHLSEFFRRLTRENGFREMADDWLAEIDFENDVEEWRLREDGAGTIDV